MLKIKNESKQSHFINRNISFIFADKGFHPQVYEILVAPYTVVPQLHTINEIENGITEQASESSHLLSV